MLWYIIYLESLTQWIRWPLNQKDAQIYSSSQALHSNLHPHTCEHANIHPCTLDTHTHVHEKSNMIVCTHRVDLSKMGTPLHSVLQQYKMEHECTVSLINMWGSWGKNLKKTVLFKLGNRVMFIIPRSS